MPARSSQRSPLRRTRRALALTALFAFGACRSTDRAPAPTPTPTVAPSAVATAGTDAGPSATASTDAAVVSKSAAAPPARAEDVAALRLIAKRRHAASIALAVIAGGELRAAFAAGDADRATHRAATADTIYLIASSSKPVVGLAAAILADTPGALDVDADIGVHNPRYPDTPVTLRQLALHTSGIARDAPGGYEDYPKPDPDGDLDAFLGPLLADRRYWLRQRPGAAESYSNIGAGLAGLVIERAAGQPFATYCQQQIFDPLGMVDTRWFIRDFTAAQRARLATPYDIDGEPYEHYGFGDWPSGQLRTTVADFGRLLLALTTRHGLSLSAIERFEQVPLFLYAEEGTFSHDGAEHGVLTSFEYAPGDAAYVYFVNSDLSDADAEALHEDVVRLATSIAARAD